MTGALSVNLVHLAFEALFCAFGEVVPLGADKLRLGPHSIYRIMVLGPQRNL